MLFYLYVGMCIIFDVFVLLFVWMIVVFVLVSFVVLILVGMFLCCFDEGWVVMLVGWVGVFVMGFFLLLLVLMFVCDIVLFGVFVWCYFGYDGVWSGVVFDMVFGVLVVVVFVIVIGFVGVCCMVVVKCVLILIVGLLVVLDGLMIV